jgi:hypothetical protein
MVFQKNWTQELRLVTSEVLMEVTTNIWVVTNSDEVAVYCTITRPCIFRCKMEPTLRHYGVPGDRNFSTLTLSRYFSCLKQKKEVVKR